MILTSVIVGGRQQLSVLSTKAATWAKMSHYRKLLLQLPAWCIIFSSTLPHVYRMKEKTIQKIMSQSLTFPSYQILLTLLGRGISRAIAFSTSVYSLLVSVTETGKWKKKKETTLFDRNPQQLSEGFSSKKQNAASFRMGGKKKTSFVFGTWLGYRWDMKQKLWQNWGDWRLGKITFPGRSSKIPETTGLNWTLNTALKVF